MIPPARRPLRLIVTSIELPPYVRSVILRVTQGSSAHTETTNSPIRMQAVNTNLPEILPFISSLRLIYPNEQSGYFNLDVGHKIHLAFFIRSKFNLINIAPEI